MSLAVTQLCKEYPTRSGQLCILRSVNLTLEEGQAAAIMGPSGTGKTTLLYILGTLETPTAGSVRLDGQDPFALSEPALAQFRNQRIGFVFQEHHLLPQCSVWENVLIPTMVQSPTAATDREERARRLLERVGLAARLDHRPSELSGGEKQRAAVARALINRPRLLLADEPTGNLDRQSAQMIGALLSELAREENAMLLVVTHSVELAATLPVRWELVDGALARSR